MKLPSKKFGIRVAAAARSAGVALAFAVFAAALLGSAPVWSQSAAVLSFVAVTTDTVIIADEGGADVELRIGLPLSHVGSRVEIELTGSGTAVWGTDYRIIAADSTPRITLGDGGTDGLTLTVESAPVELNLRLRPRADDFIRQGDRLLNLRLSRYRVVPESGGTTDLPPALDLTIRDDELPTVQQFLVGDLVDYACALLSDGSVRCASKNIRSKATPPDDLASVVQISVGREHSCALTESGRVRCWGSSSDGRTRPPGSLGPDGALGPVAQIGVGLAHSCALTVAGEVRCWGSNRRNQLMLPDDLEPVAQIRVASIYTCALTVGGEVRCWGSLEGSPPAGLDQVVQIEVGVAHSCARKASGQLICWGLPNHGRTTPPDNDELDPFVQLAVVPASNHSCALTASGRVHCWGLNTNTGQSLSLPDDLGPVAEVSVGRSLSCARTVSGRMHCRGSSVDVSSLSTGSVTAVDDIGRCALLTEGSVHCPSKPEFVPSGLRPGELVMSVWPRQLSLGERAAIRFSALRPELTSGVFTARIGVFGGLDGDISNYYSLFDSDGTTPLVAEADGSYRIEGELPTVAWLEILSSRVYIQPLELLAAVGPAPSIRKVVQSVAVSPVPLFAASTDTLTEATGGVREAQLSIHFSPDYVGRRIELELAVSGTAMAGADFSLVAADSAAGIVFEYEATAAILLRVESIPAEPLRLRLQARTDDGISQGIRLLNLRISRYQVVPEGRETVDLLPPALDFTIGDDELPAVQQLEVGADTDFACFLLSGGLLRCTGDDANGRATPPADLGLVTQIGVGVEHACALMVSGQPRCWGSDTDGRSTPPDNLGAVTQLGVGLLHTCALTVLGQLHCWGSDTDDRSTPPDDLGPVAQLAVGPNHSCALTVLGSVHCWGSDTDGRSTPPDDLGPVAQLAVGPNHSCALTVAGQLRCWGSEPAGTAMPPDDLGAVTQLAVGDEHSCALTVSGSVRCWGSDADGRSAPPDDLGAVTQLAVGDEHSCARTISGQLRCWGKVIDISSLPPGAVTAIESSGFCALLAEGSVYCRPDGADVLELVPPELRPGEVVMSLWPQRLEPGERAAIRFSDLRESTQVFTVRFEVFGDESAELDSDYRLLDGSGQPLSAETDSANSVLANFPLVAGNSGNSPMAWLEALDGGPGQPLSLYVRPFELLSASGSPPSIRLAAQPVVLVTEFLGSLTVTGPAALEQTMSAEPVLFELRVTAVGNRGTKQWQPTEALRLQYTASVPGVTVVYDSALTFSGGVATVPVSVTPSPGTDAVVIFHVAGEPGDFADVVTNMFSVDVGVADALSTVTLTVQNGLMRTVRTGQEEAVIAVQLMTAYLIANEPEQTQLRLRAMAANGVEVSGPVDVVVPAGGFTTTTLSLMLGDAEQTTVSFEVVGLPSGASLISPEVRVDLVPVPERLELSAVPALIDDLALRAEAVAEFRVRLEVQGSDGQPFGGLSLVVNTTVTDVADGEPGDIGLSFESESLVETAVGVYDSTLRVTIADGRVSAASVKLTVTVDGAGFSTAIVQLARSLVVDAFELSLADVVLEQSAAEVPVQTTATVSVQNQFGQPFSPAGLRLRVVDTATETEVLVTTPALVFDALGVAQSVLELNPRGRNRELRVEVIGVAAPGVTGNTTTLTLTAVEALGSLTVIGPSETPLQTMPAEAVVFELRIVAGGSMGTLEWQPTESLVLQHTAGLGVTADDDKMPLMFTAGVATVTVSVTPDPGNDALVTFSVTTQDPADVADLIGVAISPAEVSVGAAEVLSTVTLTVQGGLLRTPGSGQEDIPITVKLMTESFGGNEARRRELTLRAVATNGEASADVVAIIDNGFGTVELSLMLGDAEQTTVSFEVVDLPSGASLISPELRVELVVVPASLALSATPALIEELPPSGEATAEFRVKAEVLGSDGQPFGGLNDLVLSTTVTDMAVRPDVKLSYGLLEETDAGAYESTVTVMILAANRASVSVEITVAGGGTSGLAGVSTSVRLVRQAILGSLMLSLPNPSLEQSTSGESVQTVATVMARDQFGDAFSPAGLRLRVVDTVDGSVVLVTTRDLVFDAGGEARSPLILTRQLRGIDRDFRVELVGMIDPGVMANTTTLTLIAAEALGQVILTVPGGSKQFVSSRMFSIALEFSLAHAGDRPLTAATALTLQLQVEIVGGALLSSANSNVSVSGETTSSVQIAAMFTGGTVATTISLSIIGGVPAESSVVILPANTVRVGLLPADLDVDDNAVFAVGDAVLILKAANDALPDSTPERVREQLGQLLNPARPDIRLDVDGNDRVEPIDMRVLLRYLTGLRGGSLVENAADTEAIERRAREIIESLR